MISHVRVHRVLIDGGSSFNIITTKTLDQMQIPRFEIKEISKSIYGIVSSMAHQPVGHITLPVTFGYQGNF